MNKNEVIIMESNIMMKTLRNKRWIVSAAALFFVHFSLFISRTAAQTQLSEYKPGATSEGAVYFLPKTAVRISVLVEKSTYTPGDFSRYAQKYLRLNDVEQEASVSHRVISITQQPIAVADTSKVYALKFNPKTVAVNVRLSDDWRLLGINTPVSLSSPDEGMTAHATYNHPENVGGINPRRFLTEVILAAGSTAKMAELTAREIYDLRENRSLLIKGQADFMPKDGKQLQLMLQQLDEQDHALTSLFAGTTVRDTTEQVIVVTPDTPCERQLLFRLSQINGLVDADDLSGAPYYITIEDLKTVPPTDETIAAKQKQKQYEAGVYVNIPGMMRVTIYQGIDQLQQAEHPAPQFGNVELLSGALFNNRFTTRLKLNALTGAVETLDAEQPKKN